MIAAIDYGTKYIGLALSDENENFAGTGLVIRLTKNQQSIAGAAKVIYHNLKHKELSSVLIGEPLGLDGKPTRMSKEARKFGNTLEKYFMTNVKILYWNESYSSQQAATLTKSKRVDGKAAQLLLQEYINYKNTGI